MMSMMQRVCGDCARNCYRVHPPRSWLRARENFSRNWRLGSQADGMSRIGKRALVTGGAGLIGSHVTDLLVRESWKVRVLDNLKPNTHKRGKPDWINRD